MNLIGSLDTDFTGKILYNGENIGDFSEKKLATYRQSIIGFVFQNFNLIPHLTVLQNATLPIKVSVSHSEKIKKAIDILTQLGLATYIHKKPSQLSGGQCQRVAIARALINNPDIILADEPTGSLDAKNAASVLKILTKIANSGKLVIMVTHSDQVAKAATRKITMKNGEIRHDQIRTSPRKKGRRTN